MAETKLVPGSVYLYIDPLGGTAYDTVVCLQKLGTKDTTNAIDAASQCGPDKLPGKQDEQITFEGLQVINPTTLRISGVDLRTLVRNKTQFSYKIAQAVPLAGSTVETGTAFLSELSGSYDFDAASTFTGTLEPRGTSTVITHS